MLPLHRVTTRVLALALLVLGSCLSNPEPPTPHKPPAAGFDIEPLKAAFLAKHYDKQLVQLVNSQHQPDSHWTWTPCWDKATQTTIPDSATYTYVPLEPRVEVRPYVVTTVGVRKYLRFKQTARGVSFGEAAYIFVEKGNDAVPPLPPTHLFCRLYGPAANERFCYR